jgi:hypothetical protein
MNDFKVCCSQSRLIRLRQAMQDLLKPYAPPPQIPGKLAFKCSLKFRSPLLGLGFRVVVLELEGNELSMQDPPDSISERLLACSGLLTVILSRWGHSHPNPTT